MRIESEGFAATPLIMVATLVVFYIAFQTLYIGCSFPDYGKFFVCTPVEISVVFPPVIEELKDGKLLIQGKPQEEMKTRTLFAGRYSGRQTWVFITFASFIACIGCFVVATFLIYKSSSFFGENPLLRASLLIGTSIVFGWVLWRYPFYMTKLVAVLENTISAGSGGAKSVVEVMKFTIAFTFASTFALIFATCAILLPRREDASSVNTGSAETARTVAELESGLKPFSLQMSDLHLMLYAGTILLVVGVLRLSAVYRWALAFVALDETQAKALESFVASLVADVGGFFTLILAVVYIPAAYIIHKRAQMLAEKSRLSTHKSEAILKNKGLTFSFVSSLPSSFMILSPTLVGPIGDLILGGPA